MVQTATAPTAAPENPTAILDAAISDAGRLLKIFNKMPQAGRKGYEALKRKALAIILTTVNSFIKFCLYYSKNIYLNKYCIQNNSTK